MHICDFKLSIFVRDACHRQKFVVLICHNRLNTRFVSTDSRRPLATFLHFLADFHRSSAFILKRILQFQDLLWFETIKKL